MVEYKRATDEDIRRILREMEREGVREGRGKGVAQDGSAVEIEIRECPGGVTEIATLWEIERTRVRRDEWTEEQMKWGAISDCWDGVALAVETIRNIIGKMPGELTNEDRAALQHELEMIREIASDEDLDALFVPASEYPKERDRYLEKMARECGMNFLR